MDSLIDETVDNYDGGNELDFDSGEGAPSPVNRQMMMMQTQVYHDQYGNPIQPMYQQNTHNGHFPPPQHHHGNFGSAPPPLGHRDTQPIIHQAAIATNTNHRGRRNNKPPKTAAIPNARSSSERALFQHLKDQRQQTALAELTNFATTPTNTGQMPNSTTNTGRQTRAGTKNSTAVTPGATVVMQVPAAAGNNAADFLSDLRKGGDFSEEKFKQLLAFSEQVAKDNQQLHETVDIMERTNGDDGRRHATSEKAKNEMKVLHRNHTYRNYKFGNEDEEKEAVLEILYHIKHPDLDDDDHKAVFFNTWKPLTASFMGAQRSYAQGRVKDSITSFVEKNGVYPPFMWIVDLIMRKDDYFIPPHTDEDLKAARGNAKKKIEDELKTFAIKVLFAEHFQTSVLKMLVGDKFWGKKTLFYSTISEYKVLDHAGKPVQLFTASTEAFLLILCDNNWDKWRAMCKWWASKNDWKAELPVLLSAAELAAKRIKEKNPDLQQDPIAVACHTAKYTDKNAGQTKEGSTFSEAGLKQFRRFAKDIKRNRKKRKEAIVKFDKQVLELVRTKKKITGKTHEEQLLGSNRKRKPGKVAAKPRKQFRLWAIDDEDGDISESDGEEVQSNGNDSEATTDET